MLRLDSDSDVLDSRLIVSIRPCIGRELPLACYEFRLAVVYYSCFRVGVEIIFIRVILLMASVTRAVYIGIWCMKPPALLTGLTI